MSSHDCRIRGDIQLKEGVTLEQVEAAMSGFIEEHDLASLQSLAAEGEFSFDEAGGDLYLDIRFFGHGGHQNDSADQLQARLAELSIDGEYFELMDDDTGDDDARCTPYFLAGPEKGRIEYGIQAMQTWVEPVIGKESFAHIAGLIRTATAHVQEEGAAS